MAFSASSLAGGTPGNGCLVACRGAFHFNAARRPRLVDVSDRSDVGYPCRLHPISEVRMRRVTGIGGIFMSAKDPKALRDWYKKHLGIDVQAWGGATFDWTDSA